MGIKGLNKFLRQHSPKSFQEVFASQFQGTRFAIDAGNIIWKAMSVGQKESMSNVDLRSDPTAKQNNQERMEKWFDIILGIVQGFLAYEIVPIFVFDGDHIPEKVKRQKERRAGDIKDLDEIMELEEKLSKMGKLERPTEDVDRLMLLKSRQFYPDKDNIARLRRILESLGVPCIKAYGEAEKLCVMLVQEGYASAVYSEDSDCVAMGCPVTIIGKVNRRFPYHKYKIIKFDRILRDLKMEYSTFLDLCIMAQCDFNENIPNLAIGTAYKLLLIHKRIEDLPKNIPRANIKENIKLLKYKRCREIFKKETVLNCLHIEHEEELPSLDMSKPKRDELYSIDDIDIEARASAIVRLSEKIGKIEQYTIPGGFFRRINLPSGKTIKIHRPLTEFRESKAPIVTKAINVSTLDDILI